MVFEKFQMNAGSKWEGFIFDIDERSWKQTSSRKNE